METVVARRSVGFHRHCVAIEVAALFSQDERKTIIWPNGAK